MAYHHEIAYFASKSFFFTWLNFKVTQRQPHNLLIALRNVFIFIFKFVSHRRDNKMQKSMQNILMSCRNWVIFLSCRGLTFFSYEFWIGRADMMKLWNTMECLKVIWDVLEKGKIYRVFEVKMYMFSYYIVGAM